MRSLKPVLLIVCSALCMAAIPSLADAKTYVPRGMPDDAPVYKPKAFVAGSGAGGGVLGLSKMVWSSWGNSSARGSGTYRYNLCDPTCADGNYDTAPAKVRLYAPRRGCELFRKQSATTVKTSKAVFTKIEIKYDGRTFRSITSGTQTCQS